jgi:pseudoazurin
MRNLIPLALLGITTVLGAGSALAGTTDIEMLNKRGANAFVYSSDIVRIEPGDSIAFVATTKGHNAQSIKGMLPDGADEIRLGFNETKTITFTTPGVYGIRCTPHTGAGMVTAVVVGEPVNLAAAKAAAVNLPPKARQRLVAALSTLD